MTCACCMLHVASRMLHVACRRLSNFYTVFSADGKYLWGFVFPCLMWGMSACILLREAHYAHTLDRAEVISDASG